MNALDFELAALNNVASSYINLFNAAMKNNKFTYTSEEIILSEDSGVTVDIVKPNDQEISVKIVIQSDYTGLSTVDYTVWQMHLNKDITVTHDESITPDKVEYFNSLLLAGIYEYLVKLGLPE